MGRILAVDDEEEILQIIKRALEKAGHEVTTITDPQSLLEQKVWKYDLILLDVMMPQMDGFTLCKKIRDQVDCPILFLTAKTLEEDLVYGLQVGADDYITKPFGIQELRARVNAHLRREHREKRNAYTTHGLTFQLHRKELWYEDTRLNLTKSEYEICELLARHAGQVFSKEQILEEVFGYDTESDYSAIVEHIKNIRNKLTKVGQSPITTVWGVGYKWEN